MLNIFFYRDYCMQKMTSYLSLLGWMGLWVFLCPVDYFLGRIDLPEYCFGFIIDSAYNIWLQSSVRKVTLQTGKVIGLDALSEIGLDAELVYCWALSFCHLQVQAIQRMPYSDFGEGLTLLGDRLVIWTKWFYFIHLMIGFCLLILKKEGKMFLLSLIQQGKKIHVT